MAKEPDFLDSDDLADSTTTGFFARKNRAGQAWQEIRARLPENLPLPKGILIARVVVVLSIVLFAVISVIAVLKLSPLREHASLQASWHAQISQRRRQITEILMANNAEEDVNFHLDKLEADLGRLATNGENASDCSKACQKEAEAAIAAIAIMKGRKDRRAQGLLNSLELMQRDFRKTELAARAQLDRQSNVLTFLVAGALVLCCVTLLLMERSNRAKEKVASLRFRATHDPLTHGLNRAAILTLAAKELNRARRVGHALAIFLVDMDHFKEVNDHYGHPVGDSVIKQAANRLRRNVRVYDAVGRYGGDEFLVVLPDCDLSEAEIIGERLRAAFDMPLDLGAAKKRISICIGGAVFRLGDTDLEELIERADQSLYKAKEAGRNAWSIMDAPIPSLENSDDTDDGISESEIED